MRATICEWQLHTDNGSRRKAGGGGRQVCAAPAPCASGYATRSLCFPRAETPVLALSSVDPTLGRVWDTEGNGEA